MSDGRLLAVTLPVGAREGVPVQVDVPLSAQQQTDEKAAPVKVAAYLKSQPPPPQIPTQDSSGGTVQLDKPEDAAMVKAWIQAVFDSEGHRQEPKLLRKALRLWNQYDEQIEVNMNAQAGTASGIASTLLARTVSQNIEVRDCPKNKRHIYISPSACQPHAYQLSLETPAWTVSVNCISAWEAGTSHALSHARMPCAT